MPVHNSISQLDHSSRSRFRAALLGWYDREKRDLPWRGESDPYRILVSEIMLQQTRVAVVEERYRQFVRQFPTARKLARASEDSVLAAWSGLGYYRRARNLHAAAREVDQKGAFPDTSAKLMELPGIGRYTAAAVASIAFGEAVPVVDGNVKRVLERITGRELAGEAYWQAAAELLEPERPGDFNQAVMELGAVVCGPGQPRCLSCPVIEFCASRGAGERKQQKPRIKAALSYALATREDSVLLQQRAATESLMPGMWELPLSKKLIKKSSSKPKPLLKVRHSITVTDYSIMVYPAKPSQLQRGTWVQLKSLSKLPLTGLARKILKALNLLR
jgi:A/G-specific adenine glycosylase